MQKTMSNRLLWACLSAVILTPFANDVFISGMPEMARFFNTHHIGLVISVYLLGGAIMPPIAGPLLDRFGRRPVFIFGLVAYVIGSSTTLLANHFDVFLVGRLLQALGASSLIASAFATVRDSWEGHDFVKSMGIISALIGICPAIAPFFGSLMTAWGGWRLSFYFLLIAGVFYFLLIFFFFKETQEVKNLEAGRLDKIAKNYLSLLRHKPYMLYSLSSTFTYGVIFSYITMASYFIMTKFGLNALVVGWVALVLGGILFLCSLIIPRLIKHIGLPLAILISSCVLIAGSLLLLAVNIGAQHGFYYFILPVGVIFVGIGIMRPVGITGAMHCIEKKLAGTASAGFNFLTFVGASIFTALVSHFARSVIHFALAVTILSTLALVAAIFNYLLHQQQPVRVDNSN